MAEAANRAGVALLVGIGDYQHADRVERLQFAGRDAHSLAALLVNPQVCGFPRAQVRVLTDKRARRDQIVRRLSKWLPQHAQNAELVVIFFAGHGVVHKIGNREEGYLLPYDGDPDDVVTRGIAMSDIAAWISGLEAGAVVVFLDCCHAGKVIFREGLTLRGSIRQAGLGPAALQGLAGRRRFLISSCDEGQNSVEVDELKHGLFTYHLLKGIAGAGDANRDGKVEIAELFNYVTDAVARDAREKYGQVQKPWTNATWTEQVFISFPQVGAEPPSDIVAAATPAASAEETFTVEQVEQNLPTADDTFLINALRHFRRLKDPASIPLLFHCLAHRSEPVRERARRAVGAFGWKETSGIILGLAQHGPHDKLGFVMEGLAACEAKAHVVQLLDHLVLHLRGPIRDRAVILLERKQLGLGLSQVADLFAKMKSPYRIKKVVGAGPYTAAYLADVDGAELEVVVRVLRREFIGVVSIRNQFCELNSRLLPLFHHNLVHTREARAFPEHDIYYTVRDFVNAPTLREVLESGKKFELAQVLKILQQVTEALIPLHQKGLLHGGIKPSNIFVQDRAILGDSSLPLPGLGVDPKRLAYDLRYCPPELSPGSAGGSPRADFYALGCVAHELFCAQPPYLAEANHELLARHLRDPIPKLGGRVPRLAPAIDPFMRKLLAKSPADRFANVDDLLQAIQELQTLLRSRPPGPDHPGVTVERPPAPPSPTMAGPPDLPPTLSRHPEKPAAKPAKKPAEQPPPPADSQLIRDASLQKFLGRHSVVSMPTQTGPEQETGEYVAPRVPRIPGYEIEKVLGEGGMGVVFLARQVALKRRVAIKMLRETYLRSDTLLRFRREAEAVARIQHPNIVQIYELGEFQGAPFLCLEYVDGGSLSAKIKGQPQPVRESAALVRTLARAMHHAHELNIIHRDIKPANILLTEGGLPKISDFGLAKQLEDDAGPTLTGAGAVMGTPSYMAPEQASGDVRDLGPAVDVYGLGATLYTMLTGRPPFQGATTFDTLMQVRNDDPIPPSRLRRGVPHDLETICLKCLSKLPERRYPSAAELADDLERFLDGRAVAARRTRRLERLWRWSRRNPAQAILAAVLLAMLLSGLTALWLYYYLGQ